MRTGTNSTKVQGKKKNETQKRIAFSDRKSIMESGYILGWATRCSL